MAEKEQSAEQAGRSFGRTVTIWNKDTLDKIPAISFGFVPVQRDE